MKNRIVLRHRVREGQRIRRVLRDIYIPLTITHVLPLMSGLVCEITRKTQGAETGGA